MWGFEMRDDHFRRGARHHELPQDTRTRRQRPTGIGQPELAQRLRIDEGGEHLSGRALISMLALTVCLS